MTNYSFSKRSLLKLATVHQDLQNTARLALEWGVMDFTVIEGRRDKETQTQYFNNGRSKVTWPHSKHNVENPQDLANAYDIAPVINGKISWDHMHCIHLAGIIISAGRCLGVKIRWGGNWDLDGEPVTDQDFQDLVHYERVVQNV